MSRRAPHPHPPKPNQAHPLATPRRSNIYIYTDKTSLKADREDWGGDPLLTLAPLKTPAKHRENEHQQDHSHRKPRGTKGTNEIP